MQSSWSGRGPGVVVRAARLAQEVTIAQLGARVGYSASEVSRYERGIVALTDTGVLRRFATALGIAPQQLGLHVADEDSARHAAGSPDSHPCHAHGHTVTPRACTGGRRRPGAAASAAGGPPIAASGDTADPGELLAVRVRDAMLGLSPAPARISTGGLEAGLAAALTGFRMCQNTRLAGLLPD
jgi:Helix-turn-helix domain